HRDPGVVNEKRRQIRLGEVAIILGFFLGALAEGFAAGVVPAARLLDDTAAGIKQGRLSRQFKVGAVGQRAKAVEILQFNARPVGVGPARANADVRLDAQDAFFHVTGVHAEVAQDAADMGGVGPRVLAGADVRLGYYLQQGYARAVIVDQRAATL